MIAELAQDHLSSAAHTKFREDALEVLFHGLDTEVELFCYFLVRKSSHEERDNRVLPDCERATVRAFCAFIEAPVADQACYGIGEQSAFEPYVAVFTAATAFSTSTAEEVLRKQPLPP